jgi:hypothetical protein
MTTDENESAPREEVEARLLLARLKSLRWKDAAGHFAIIVVGVMVALFADAWREGRNDRQREAAYIVDIRSDLVTMLKIVEGSIRADSEILGRAEAMHAYLQSTDEVPEDSVRDWRNLGTSGFVPVSGTLRALFETSDLRLLSREVRHSLSAYSTDLQYAERQLDLLAVDVGASTRLIREREEAYRHYSASRSGPNPGRYTLNVNQMRADPVIRAAYANVLVGIRTHRQRLLDFRGSVLGFQKVLATDAARR